MGSHILAAPPWQGSQGRDRGGEGQLNEKKKCSGDGCCLHLRGGAGGGGAILDNRSLSLVWDASGRGRRRYS